MAGWTLLTRDALQTAMQGQWDDVNKEWAPGFGTWADWAEPLVEDMVEAFLGRRVGEAAGIVEWHGSEDDREVYLDRTPVQAVTEVRYDPTGGYGQVAGSFGTDTVLVAGTDYYLALDGGGATAGWSDSGRLVRQNSNWGFSTRWDRNLLTPRKVPSDGTIKVTYTGGYPVAKVPGAVSQAVALAVARVWQFTPQPVIVNYEMWGGYSYSHSLSFNMAEPIFTDIRSLLTQYKRLHVGRR
ncbi:MAG: hypothetical protein K2X82_30150 [Gemmataceae bacterium]|nr:hypothetical protein [Gemmataceae bacterium]